MRIQLNERVEAMKWTTEDVKTYLDAREYVDTAVLPLVPVSFGSEMKNHVAMGEFITVICDEVEKQFKGRVFQVPPFTYMADEDLDTRIERLEKWVSVMREQGLKYVFFVTSDHEWKKKEGDLHNMLIWMPVIPFEHLDMAYRKQIISEQIKQLLPLMVDKWKNNPLE